MGKFNYASKKLETEQQKLAARDRGYTQNFYGDEEDEDAGAVGTRPPVRPAVRLNPSTGPAARPVGRRSYEDFGGAEPAAAPVAAPLQNTAITNAKEQMARWVQQAAQNPEQAPPLDLQWLRSEPIVPSVPDSIWITEFNKTVNSVLKRQGWPSQKIESFITRSISDARQARGFTDESTTSKERSLHIAPSMKSQEPHAMAFADMLNKQIMTNPMIATMLGTDNMESWPAEKTQAFTDAVHTAFAQPYSSKALRNEVRFFTVQENVQYLPDPVRQQVEPFKNHLPKDRMLLSPAQGKAQKAMEQQEPMASAIRNTEQILSQPENLKLIQAQLQKLFGEVSSGTGMLADPAAKQRFLMATISRLKQQMSGRERDLNRRKKDQKSMSIDGSDGDGAQGLAEGLTDGSPSDDDGLSDKSFQDARSQMTDKKLIQEQKVYQKIDQLGYQIGSLADEMRSLGDDLATFISKSKPRVPGDPADLRNAVIKSLRNKKMPIDEAAIQQGIAEKTQAVKGGREDQFVLAEKIRSYTNAISKALKDIQDPNSVDGEKLMKHIASQMVKREEGNLADASSFQRPGNIPDLDPNKQYSPQNPQEAAMYQQVTDHQPGQGLDPSKFNRTTMLELVGEQSLIKAVRDRAQQFMSYTGRGKDPATAKPHQFSQQFQNVGNMLDKKMDEGRPKQDMRQSFGDWGVFLILPEVQKKYSTAVRRLLTDVMPLKHDYATGKGALGAAWSSVYHAARGELHKAPGHVGFDGKKPADMTPQGAMAKLRALQEEARQSAGFSAVNRRWSRLERAKQQAEAAKAQIQAMNSRNLMLKSAQVDISHIDEMIAHIDSEIIRECDLFFNALRA